MLEGNYDPGFYVEHYIKDMRIALEEAQKENLSLPILSEVLGMFEELDEMGESRSGTQVLIKRYEK